MPLIGKKEFIPQVNASPLPDEVYYNGITNEIFTSYESYLRRIDEISQSQWTCSVTGKTGLTYLQACESENEARAVFRSIPEVLRKVLAVLMTHMKTYSSNVAQSLLYEFTNLRYFIGEEIQLLSPGRRRQDVTILKVIPPDVDPDTKGTFAYGLNPLAHEYIVELVNDDDEVVELRVPASRLTRHKGRLTHEKIRLFMKMNAIQKNRFEHFVLRDGFDEELGINNIEWTDIFAGPEPNFNVDTTVMKALGKKAATENLDSDDDGDRVKKTNPIILKKKSNILSAAKKKMKQRINKEKGKSNERGKKQKLKDKENKKKIKMTPLDKERQKEIVRESRKAYEENFKNWLEKRDDLLCDDLKELPKSWEIKLNIDVSYLKEIFMITEFVNTFGSFINGLKDYFPDCISFQMILDMLIDTEIGGPFGALVQLVFSTILNSHSENHGSLDTEDIKIDNNLEMDHLDSTIQDDNIENNISSNFTNNWVSTYFNTHEQLSKLKLNQFTISELLRIYILKVRDVDMKTRKRTKMSDTEVKLVKVLAVKNFLELNPDERLELFNLLIQDFFTIPEVIEKIDETNQTIYKLKIEIRHLNASHTKWLREHPIRNRIRKKKGTENGIVSEDASLEEKEAYRKEKTEREEKLSEEIGSMKAQIRKLSLFSREFCLGEDRLFRKYWIFQYIPGIFVEHVPTEQLEFPCLEIPIPIKKPVMSDYLQNSAKRKARKSNTKNTTNDNDISISHESIPIAIDHCTGHKATCSVHGHGRKISHTIWSMYAEHQLDDLIDALNTRGNRESELRTSLEYERKSIIADNLAHFDPKLFNQDYVEPPPPPPPPSEPEPELEPESNAEAVILENETRKSARILKNAAAEKANMNNHHSSEKITVDRKRKIQRLIPAKYQNMESIESHLNAFLDELSEFSDRIFVANFSTFDESHWQEWRDELNSCHEKFDQSNIAIKMLILLFKNLAISLKSFCLLPPLVVTLESSNLHSPSDKENIEIEQLKDNVISDKWLELLRLISQENDQDDLMDSSYGLSSISQLFVNYCILDKSINWELSAEKTASRCKACKRRIGNNGERIICDRCNRGYHPNCLKIRSTEELKNNWLCVDCSPRNGQAIIESETIEITEKCGSCNFGLKTNEREIHCRECSKTFHLACSGLNRAPRGPWSCKKCTNKQKRRKESSDVDISGDHEVRRSGRKRRALIYSDDDDDYDYLPR